MGYAVVRESWDHDSLPLLSFFGLERSQLELGRGVLWYWLHVLAMVWFGVEGDAWCGRDSSQSWQWCGVVYVQLDNKCESLRCGGGDG